MTCRDFEETALSRYNRKGISRGRRYKVHIYILGSADIIQREEYLQCEAFVIVNDFGEVRAYCKDLFVDEKNGEKLIKIPELMPL